MMTTLIPRETLRFAGKLKAFDPPQPGRGP